ncbi:MAG: hypothetical protein H6839_13945 [Planctomycetes bacterium]|nr:hypothetical protein [Planctomycetota bacterium]
MFEMLIFLAKKGDTSTLPFILALVGMLVFVLGIAVIVGLAQAKKQKAWANSVGLKYNNKGLSGVDDMSGVFNGFQVEVGQDTSFGGGSVSALTTFTLWFPQPILPPFELLKADVPVKFSERENLQPVRTGHAGLDRTYGVFTNHAQEVCGMVTDPRVVGILMSAASRYPRVWISELVMVYYTPPRGTSTAAYTGHLKALTAAAAVLFEIATGQPAPRGRPAGRQRRGGRRLPGKTVAAPPPAAPPTAGPVVQAPQPLSRPHSNRQSAAPGAPPRPRRRPR